MFSSFLLYISNKSTIFSVQITSNLVVYSDKPFDSMCWPETKNMFAFFFSNPRFNLQILTHKLSHCCLLFHFFAMQMKNFHNHCVRSFSEKIKSHFPIFFFSISAMRNDFFFYIFDAFSSSQSHTIFIFFMNLNYHYHTLFALELNWWLYIFFVPLREKGF